MKKFIIPAVSLAALFAGAPAPVRFEARPRVVAKGSYPQIAVRASGTISLLRVEGGDLWYFASNDGGDSFEPAVRVNSAPGDLRKGLTFSLERITGLKTPEDWHNTGLTIILDDNDHMTQHWTYLYKGQPGTTDFHYTRKK